MPNKKLIIIGTSLSGKTTLVRSLRLHNDLRIAEMDEELVIRNGGQYPKDYKYKHNILAPEVIADILNRGGVIFFTNTDYFSLDTLRDARGKGFKVVQLSLDLEHLNQRNRKRIEKENYEDASQWFEGMLRYQTEVQKAGLVDATIDANLPTAEIIEKLLTIIN